MAKMFPLRRHISEKNVEHPQPVMAPRNNVFLRSVGIELLGAFPWRKLSLWGNVDISTERTEPLKPVLQRGFLVALSRCGVHLLPSAVSLTIILLNTKRLFLGRSLQEGVIDDTTAFAILQIAAKLQEVLIIASLATIVIHTIRQQILSAEGVPLGLISGIFSFTDIRYLLSAEFWGSMTSKNSKFAKFRVYSILVIAAALATTAGPATAVLMIPRSQQWAAGGSPFWIRGTPSDLWPLNMTYQSNNTERYCSYENATTYSVCPSGGYSSMRGLLSKNWVRTSHSCCKLYTTDQMLINPEGTRAGLHLLQILP